MTPQFKSEIRLTVVILRQVSKGRQFEPRKHSATFDQHENQEDNKEKNKTTATAHASGKEGHASFRLEIYRATHPVFCDPPMRPNGPSCWDAGIIA